MAGQGGCGRRVTRGDTDQEVTGRRHCITDLFGKLEWMTVVEKALAAVIRILNAEVKARWMFQHYSSLSITSLPSLTRKVPFSLWVIFSTCHTLQMASFWFLHMKELQNHRKWNEKINLVYFLKCICNLCLLRTVHELLEESSHGQCWFHLDWSS